MKQILNICLLIVVQLFIQSGFTQETSRQANKSERRFGDIHQVVQTYVNRDWAVGAELLIVESGNPVFHQSYGLSDRESGRAWSNNTLCNIRSMTKPITSAAAQILIDRGQLQLDQPVAKYLAGFDNDKSRSITVRQVLTHRSGHR